MNEKAKQSKEEARTAEQLLPGAMKQSLLEEQEYHGEVGAPSPLLGKLLQLERRLEQPDQRAKKRGFDSLSDAELLAIILRTGTRESGCVGLCEEILAHVGGKLVGLMNTTHRELERIHGVGPVKANQLLGIAELSKRIWRDRPEARLDCKSAEAIYRHFREDFRYLEQEVLSALYLDSKGELIAKREIAKGTVNMVIASPREIFLHALRANAACFILIHNHPSGDPTPSAEDLRLTRSVDLLGDCLGLPMIDHLIFGNHDFRSIKPDGRRSADGGYFGTLA